MEDTAEDERHPWNRTIGDLLHFLVLLFLWNGPESFVWLVLPGIGRRE